MHTKILIVDDDHHILQGYKRSLRKHFSLITAESAQEALEIIAREGPFAIVVSDMRMPGMDGLQLLTYLRETLPDTIRIMLTGNADQKTAVDAVNKGDVFRFLTKPCNADTMAMTLEAGLAYYRQMIEKHSLMEEAYTEVRSLSEKLAFRSQNDLLTGLRNRQYFELVLQRSLESARRRGFNHALCIIDLDNFHVINDTCGHVAGDECLRQVANLLSSQQRLIDVISRLTADQFAILLTDCQLDEAKRLLGGLHELLRQFTFRWEDEVFEINASLGLLAINSTSANVTSLISAAETACHVAKERGRDCFHISETNDQNYTQRLSESQWIQKINQALKHDHFRLYHQLITPLPGIEAAGEHFEVLLRLVDLQGELVLPGHLLQVAEHNLLSTQIDRWVIRNISDWLLANPQRLDRLTMCAINLSGHSLGNKDIYNLICERFVQQPIPTHKIWFEVTETTAITHLQEASEFIRALKSQGFHFSLDDFGTGFASFAYLKNLPVDSLKINGEFIRNIHGDPVDRAMVKSIIEIARLMDKFTIAEYVENEQILEVLQELGADYAQGFHFSRPRPLIE